MGHRAIVAYERKDGMYSLHYSHRGGHRQRLQSTLRNDQPFGDSSDEEWANDVVEKIRAGETIESEQIDVGSDSVEIDPVPRATASGFDALGIEHVNYLHYEAVYLVSLDWTVETWLPVWYGLKYDSSCVVDAPLVGNGALIKVPDRTQLSVDHQPLIAKWMMLRDVVGDGIDREWLSPDKAGQYLDEKLRELVRPDCEVWLSPDRTIGSVIG